MLSLFMTGLISLSVTVAVSGWVPPRKKHKDKKHAVDWGGMCCVACVNR